MALPENLLNLLQTVDKFLTEVNSHPIPRETISLQSLLQHLDQTLGSDWMTKATDESIRNATDEFLVGKLLQTLMHAQNDLDNHEPDSNSQVQHDQACSLLDKIVEYILPRLGDGIVKEYLSIDSAEERKAFIEHQQRMPAAAAASVQHDTRSKKAVSFTSSVDAGPGPAAGSRSIRRSARRGKSVHARDAATVPGATPALEVIVSSGAVPVAEASAIPARTPNPDDLQSPEPLGASPDDGSPKKPASPSVSTARTLKGVAIARPSDPNITPERGGRDDPAGAGTVASDSNRREPHSAATVPAPSHIPAGQPPASGPQGSGAVPTVGDASLPGVDSTGGGAPQPSVDGNPPPPAAGGGHAAAAGAGVDDFMRTHLMQEYTATVRADNTMSFRAEADQVKLANVANSEIVMASELIAATLIRHQDIKDATITLRNGSDEVLAYICALAKAHGIKVEFQGAAVGKKAHIEHEDFSRGIVDVLHGVFRATDEASLKASFNDIYMTAGNTVTKQNYFVTFYPRGCVRRYNVIAETNRSGLSRALHEADPDRGTNGERYRREKYKDFQFPTARAALNPSRDADAPSASAEAPSSGRARAGDAESREGDRSSAASRQGSDQAAATHPTSRLEAARGATTHGATTHTPADAGRADLQQTSVAAGRDASVEQSSRSPRHRRGSSNNSD